MDLFEDFFGRNNRRRREEDEFFRLLNEMMRKHQRRLDNDLRNGGFPNFNIQEQKGDNWTRRSGMSDDGNMMWSSFTKSGGNDMGQEDINEILTNIFGQPHMGMNTPPPNFRPMTTEEKLEIYKEDLKEAIEIEDYEKAVKLRDLIKELEEKNN